MRQGDETQCLGGRVPAVFHPWRELFSPVLNQLGCVFTWNLLDESPDPNFVSNDLSAYRLKPKGLDVLKDLLDATLVGVRRKSHYGSLQRKSSCGTFISHGGSHTRC